MQILTVSSINSQKQEMALFFLANPKFSFLSPFRIEYSSFPLKQVF